MYQRVLQPISARKGVEIDIEGCSYISFVHNDYLNLSQSSYFDQHIEKILKEHGMGSGGSRLLGGDHDLFHDLETDLAGLFVHKECLLFNSGYQCNIGVIASFFKKGDVIFADKYIHASCIDAIRLSGAKLVRYRHLDLVHLKTLLAKNRYRYRRALLLSESLFSMDGDIADIDGLIALKKLHDCFLMIDDAHAFGVLGKRCLGLGDDYQEGIDFIVGTFGKALGGQGAFVLCDLSFKLEMVQSCRSFIYSTSLPLPVIAWNRSALQWILNHQSIIHDYCFRVQQFKRSLGGCMTCLGEAHILSLLFQDTHILLQVVAHLKEKGFFVAPIFSPTVPLGLERIRLSLTRLHTESILDQFLSDLNGSISKISS